MVNVTHNNFDSVVSAVKAGDMVMFIPTYTKTTKIDDKCFSRFEKLGLNPIVKSSDGKGYRLRTGKSNLYIFSYQLKAV